VIDEYRIISQRWLNCDKEIKKQQKLSFLEKEIKPTKALFFVSLVTTQQIYR
jgi:hypothetical protein